MAQIHAFSSLGVAGRAGEWAPEAGFGTALPGPLCSPELIAESTLNLPGPFPTGPLASRYQARLLARAPAIRRSPSLRAAASTEAPAEPSLVPAKATVIFSVQQPVHFGGENTRRWLIQANSATVPGKSF